MEMDEDVDDTAKDDICRINDLNLHYDMIKWNMRNYLNVIANESAYL